MGADSKSRWDVIYSFVGYGGVVGPACVIAYLKAESVIRGGLSELSPQSVLLTGASVLASIMLVLPMGFMLALPAAVSAGLIYSITPVRWRRIWVAAIIGLVTAAALATGLQLTLGFGGPEIALAGAVAASVASYMDGLKKAER